VMKMLVRRREVAALFTIACMISVAVLALFSGSCGRKGAKLSPEEICYMNQRSIDGAIKAYKEEKGEYPKSLEDLKKVPYLAGTMGSCPEGGKYIWIPGDPPQVKCSKHGIPK